MANRLQSSFSVLGNIDNTAQKTLELIRKLIDDVPNTNADTSVSQSTSVTILTHLLGLMDSAGLLNGLGFHASAITLMRPIEDATDCLVAVGLDGDSAIKWKKGKFKASDAAKIWTSELKFNDGSELSQYRKQIRSLLNNYSHCSLRQTQWNMYLETISDNQCTVKLNTIPKVITLNGHYIDKYLLIHLSELIDVLFLIYENYFSSHEDTKQQLDQLQKEIEIHILRFLKTIKSDSLNISLPPELAPLKDI